jgi:CBS domain-containing protein
MPGDPVLEGVPETAEELGGDVLRWIQDTLEIDDRTTAGLFGVDPPAIEEWRRHGVPVAHVDIFRRLREVASRFHGHHAASPGELIDRPLRAYGGRTLLDLIADPTVHIGRAVTRVLSNPATVTGTRPSAPRNVPAQIASDLMEHDPVVVDADDTLQEAGRRMRAADIGDVVVIERGQPVGMLTDRDIVVRAVADRRDVRITHCGHIATRPLIAVEPGTPVEEAMRLMRSGGVRRLPVVEEGRLVGIIGLGDLVVEFDPESPLADVVVAPTTD